MANQNYRPIFKRSYNFKHKKMERTKKEKYEQEVRKGLRTIMNL